MFTEGSPGGIQNSYPKKLEQGLGYLDTRVSPRTPGVAKLR